MLKSRLPFSNPQMTTFVVYVGSSLITSSIPYLVTAFDIPENEALVGLSVYVFAYVALLSSP